MGQFTTRPEEPAEWAGLPSEPLESHSAAETLAAPAGSVASIGVWAVAVESVVIPVESAIDQSAPDAADSGPPD
jgi:hypothetical protein